MSTTIHLTQQNEPTGSNERIRLGKQGAVTGGHSKITLPNVATAQPYQLTAAAATSAGVYDANNVLIRALWSNQRQSAGTHIAYWDGKDNAGNSVAINGHTIKVLSSNVTYQWEGGAVIGNSGTNASGATTLHTDHTARDVCFIGDEVYWALEYAERKNAQWLTSLAHPENGKTWVETPQRQTNQNTGHTCTDGTYVYWGGFDPYSSPVFSFVWATVAATKQRVTFANGVAAQMKQGSIYASTISGVTLDNSYISGMAVQRTGNCLFVARKVQNEVQVLHKTTGALLQTYTIGAAGRMAIDTADYLWIVSGTAIQRYAVGGDGSLSLIQAIETNAVISGIDISPDGSTLAACDMNSQQLKGYNTTAGTLTWTLGTAGGYLTDATVTNTKFFWNSAQGVGLSFIKYTPDGGFYLGDGGNWRYLQFDSSRNYVRTISWMPSQYVTTVDPNNPQRLFCGSLEFEIDYTKPLAQGWKLKNNWAATLTDTLYDRGAAPNIVTFPQNGKTYGLIRGIGLNQVKYYIAELAAGGTMRISAAASITPLTSYLQPDGSLVISTGTATTRTLTQYALTGFDGSNFPVWSSTGTIINNITITNFNFNSVAILPGKVIAFDISARTIYDNSDYHVMAYPIGSSTPLWKTARGTSRDYAGPYPDDGWFDNGNGVNTGLNGGGGFMSTVNNHLIWNYHGEFWKNSQTNKYHHIDAATGLLIGTFGTANPDNITRAEAPYGQDGNALTGSLVYVNGTYYVYHCGEDYGTHRWKLQGTDTITVQTFPAVVALPADKGLNLLEGLPQYVSLADGQGGWNRFPAVDYNNTSTDYWKVRTGYFSYDPMESPDISISYAQNTGSAYASRTLGNNTGIPQWSIQGEVYFSTSFINSADSFGTGGVYVEVLDSAGKVICRTYRFAATNGSNVMWFNDKTIYTDGADKSMTARNYHYQPFTIIANSGVLHFNYSDLPEQSTTVLTDSSAVWNNPATLRIYCFADKITRNSQRTLAMRRLYFKV